MGSSTSVDEAEAAAASAAAAGHDDDESELSAWADALGSVECNADEASAWSALRAAIDPWARPVVLAAERLRHEEEVRRSGRVNGRWRKRRLRWVLSGGSGGGGSCSNQASSSEEASAPSSSLSASECAVESPAAGCVVSLPGARAQSMHRDGAQPGLINAFVPLVRITEANGATELVPRTHRGVGVADADGALSSSRRGVGNCRRPRRSRSGSRSSTEAANKPVAPLLAAGEVLLFDYRILHHGLANRSEEPRPVGYVVYTASVRRSRIP